MTASGDPIDISLRVAPVRPVDQSTLVLGIETSCDETAAAIVMGGRDVVSSVV
jgi:N6-L-threonylcarbamoyladenine synthase